MLSIQPVATSLTYYNKLYISIQYGVLIMFKFNCEGCGKKYKVEDDWAGKFVKCKKCDHRMHIFKTNSDSDDIIRQSVIKSIDDEVYISDVYILIM